MFINVENNISTEIRADVQIYNSNHKFECYNWCGQNEGNGQCQGWKYWMEIELDLILQCECNENKWGFDCSQNYQQIELNKNIFFDKLDNDWINLAFQPTTNNTYTIDIDQLSQQSQVQITFKDYDTYIQHPNFEIQSYYVSKTIFSFKLDDQVLINNYVSEQTANQQQPVIIISIYTQNISNDKKQGNIRVQQNNVEEDSTFPLIAIIGIAVISLIIVICVINCIFRFYYKNQRNVNEQEIVQQNGTQQVQNIQNELQVTIKKVYVIITQQTIDKYMPDMLYSFLYNNIPQFQKESKECTVCLCEFEKEERCRVTVCFHLFHKECLDSWIKKHGTCPYCRHKITRKILEDQQQLIKEYQSDQYLKKVIKEIKSLKYKKTIEDFDFKQLAIDHEERVKKEKDNNTIISIQNQIPELMSLQIKEIESKEQGDLVINPLKLMKEFDFLFQNQELIEQEIEKSQIQQKQKDGKECPENEKSPLRANSQSQNNSFMNNNYTGRGSPSQLIEDRHIINFDQDPVNVEKDQIDQDQINQDQVIQDPSQRTSRINSQHQVFNPLDGSNNSDQHKMRTRELSMSPSSDNFKSPQPLKPQQQMSQFSLQSGKKYDRPEDTQQQTQLSNSQLLRKRNKKNKNDSVSQFFLNNQNQQIPQDLQQKGDDEEDDDDEEEQKQQDNHKNINNQRQFNININDSNNDDQQVNNMGNSVPLNLPQLQRIKGNDSLNLTPDIQENDKFFADKKSDNK